MLLLSANLGSVFCNHKNPDRASTCCENNKNVASVNKKCLPWQQKQTLAQSFRVLNVNARLDRPFCWQLLQPPPRTREPSLRLRFFAIRFSNVQQANALCKGFRDAVGLDFWLNRQSPDRTSKLCETDKKRCLRQRMHFFPDNRKWQEHRRFVFWCKRSDGHDFCWPPDTAKSSRTRLSISWDIFGGVAWYVNDGELGKNAIRRNAMHNNQTYFTGDRAAMLSR